MKTKTKTVSANSPRYGRMIGIGFFVLLCLLLVLIAAAIGWYSYQLNTYHHRFYPGVHIGAFDLSGKTYLDAYDILEERVAEFENGIAVVYAIPQTSESEHQILLTPTVLPLYSDGNERDLFSLTFEESLKAAYAVGREDDWQTRIKRQYAAWKFGRVIEFDYTIDQEYIVTYLEDEFAVYEQPATNANIVIAADGTVEMIEETVGHVFDFTHITQAVEQRIREFNTSPLHLTMETDVPKVTIDDIRAQRNTIDAYLDQTPIKVAFTENDTTQEWEFDRATVGGWLRFDADTFHLDPEALEESFTDVAQSINREVKEARWKVEKDEYGVKTGLTEIQTAENGRAVDYATTADRIHAFLSARSASIESIENDGPIEVALTIVEPQFTIDTVHTLEIRDLLGTGHSNMAGSPTNRKKNVSRGVELLNGLLIPPDEIFSLVESLKPFTLENGYLPELVIKGNETIPEIAGGLCQIGTTTFRGAMNAGLDIYERRNHSYAVSYYSDDRNGQPGTDATIYDPSPDFKFYNDTPGYILLQTRVEGNDLYFDYWGVSDGRVAEFTPPVVSNWVQPPPLKEIPTTDLAPGERKCTESAHAGVSASFTYTVDYPDGKHHEETFDSVYQPWQAVCLVGVTQEELTKRQAESTTDSQ